jgi:glycosyltransferase involved in cell wall biosynthesis
MSISTPLISVGMPVFNGERYLAESIESVLAQTYGHFELVISDNASTDGTSDICRRYAAQDDRIVYLRNASNVGAARNYNQLFSRTTGAYFRWFNADDLSAPDLHERCLSALLAHPSASMACGLTSLIDAQGHITERLQEHLDLQQASVSERFFAFLRVARLTNAIYGLMRRSALERTALMGDGSYPAADSTLMAELVLQGVVVEIPTPLFMRRMHEQASSWDRRSDAVQQAFWTGRNNRFEMPTFKQKRALLAAIARAPAQRAERRAMQWYVLKSMVWAHASITHEALAAVQGFAARSLTKRLP